MSLLGVDIGTTGCKAVVYSVDGLRISRNSSTYQINRIDGKAELSVSLVESSIATAIKEAVAGARKDPVTSVCITSMGESFVLVDDAGPVWDKSIIGHDPRGKAEIDSIIDKIGRDEFYRITSNQPNENYSLSKLLWLQKNEPAVLNKAIKFLCWSDYINFRLGAIPATGYSHANRTLVFDFHEKKWSDQIIGTTGLNPDIFPMILPEGSVVGTVNTEGEKRFGVPKGAVIILGGHDQIFNALGSGCVQSGMVVDGMGTFECITPVYDKPPLFSEQMKLGLNLEHHALSGLYVSFIYNQSGSVVEWFLSNFAKDVKTLDTAFTILESEMPIKPARPLFLPLLENSGSPYFISNSSGVYEGLKFDTTRGELFKATLEGITFYFLESLKKIEEWGIRLDEMVVTGGASVLDSWLQLKSDVFGIPVTRLEVKDAGAMGAAMLAGIRTDVYRNPEEAVGLYVKKAKRFEPNRENQLYYQEKYGLYKNLFIDSQERLHALSKLSGY